MPIYKYCALAGNGIKNCGFLMAKDYKSAYNTLIERKCHPLSMREARLSRQKISVEDLLMFFFHIDMQLKCKVRIDKAIESFLDMHHNEVLKASLVTILNSLKNGLSLGAAFETCREIFGWTIVVLLKSAEQTGHLSDIIKNILKFLKLQADWKNKVKRAIAYPAFVALVAISILIFSICLLGPQVLFLLGDIDQRETPPMTQFVLYLLPPLAEAAGYFFGALLLGLLLGLLSKRGRILILNILLKIPKIGPIALKISLWQFCQILHIALNAKLNFMEAMQLSITSMAFESVKTELIKTKNLIADGYSIGESFAKTKFMTHEMLSAIFMGEESGDLSASFSSMSHTQYEEILLDLKMLGRQLSVGLAIFTGFVLLLIVSGLLFPIYSYVEVAGA
ncbi:MAG: type II secretion system F family protein [Holosporaceae bacterium]|jgi:type II secretory pathway component PulF|nr:type II secretion system F family protein [Holosporaceae bacterium]